MAKRSNIALAILAAVATYGLWELWHAAAVTGDMSGYLFGIAFIGGALYGLRVTLAEARDLVVALDADPDSGQATISLWRPFRMKQIETRLDRLAGWRHWVQTNARGQHIHYLIVQDPSRDAALRLELHPGQPITDELRMIARAPIADFERETRAAAKNV